MTRANALGLSGAALFTLALSTLSTPALAERAHGPSGVVYVDANDYRPGRNAVLAFRRDEAGQLTPLPGSPFPTGGTGVDDDQSGVGIEDSSQDILVNPEHTLLFAVNPGSDSIAVFQIEEDGSLTPAPGSPFPSGGVEPVSLGLAGNSLYVAHKDFLPFRAPGSATGYTGFHVAGNGVLTPIPGSTFAAPVAAFPSQALISPNGRFLFDAQTLAGAVQALRIEPNGRLSQIAGAPLPMPAGILPLGLAAHPTEPLVYAGFATSTQVGVIEYDPATGVPSLLGAAGTSGVAPCWLAADAAGEYLYSVNPGDRSVSRLSLADPRDPVEVQHVSLHPAGLTSFPFQIHIDGEGRFLYVVSQQGFAFNPDDAETNALHVLRIEEDGTLVEAPSSPHPLPIPYFTRAQGVAAL